MHIAIIMDGNGRWAAQRGLPRTAGHRAGAKAVDKVVEAAARHGIGTLSLYAFSADNWRRPQGRGRCAVHATTPILACADTAVLGEVNTDQCRGAKGSLGT